MTRLAQRVSAFWLSIAVMMLIYGASSLMPIYAQASATDVKISDLDRRVTAIDEQNFGERLTRLETQMVDNNRLGELNNKLIVGIFGGVLIMILERAFSFRSARKIQEKLREDE